MSHDNQTIARVASYFELNHLGRQFNLEQEQIDLNFLHSFDNTETEFSVASITMLDGVLTKIILLGTK